jgi:hypothetical protein
MLGRLTFTGQPGTTIPAGTPVAVQASGGSGWYNGEPFTITETSYYKTQRAAFVGLDGRVTVDILPLPVSPAERILQAIIKAKLS